ncbi:hypothetical protein D3C81_2083590 [compost metagenome]
MERVEFERIFEEMYAQKKAEEAQKMAGFYVRGLESVSAGLGPTENRYTQDFVHIEKSDSGVRTSVSSD